MYLTERDTMTESVQENQELPQEEAPKENQNDLTINDLNAMSQVCGSS